MLDFFDINCFDYFQSCYDENVFLQSCKQTCKLLLSQNWINLTIVENIFQKKRLKNFKYLVMTINSKAVLGNQ